MSEKIRGHSHLVPKSKLVQKAQIGQHGALGRQMGVPPYFFAHSIEETILHNISKKIGQCHYEPIFGFFRPGHPTSNPEPNATLGPKSDIEPFQYEFEYY